ncbi:MAG: protoporphyrinogen oxidase HemJ [Amaricoccus sp.]|uniref:protoporphyrinogen oxidase HemJ n=1 Tax=Amaricoccus sp. TaxID=1872485 RepID=UPI0033160CB9
MREILSAVYPWTKVLHIVSMVAWMAGLFYLPRLFVYHAEKAPPGTEISELFKVMERRLLRAIMNPAMFGTWIFGGMLLLTPGIIDWRHDFWIYPKLSAVGLLTWFHHWLGRRRKDFKADRNLVSGRRYRMMNEIPTLSLLLIVTMVVVRPF